MKGLPPEVIKELLNNTIKSKLKYNGAVSIGPLRRKDTVARCASRGCGTESYNTVNGIPYCTIHSLDALNEIILNYMKIDTTQCNCQAGKYSRFNRHTGDCPLTIADSYVSYLTERLFDSENNPL